MDKVNPTSSLGYDNSPRLDHSQSNPGLHFLYVRWACVHLDQIDKAIKHFAGFSNLNTDEVVEVLVGVRQKLCKEQAAYNDANRILACMEAGKTEIEGEL